MVSFSDLDINDISNELLKLGYEKMYEIMYNGQTGEQIATEIFIGPYLSKLKHMVSDKQHVVQLDHELILQDSLQRVEVARVVFAGEMERDCMISYGASVIYKGRVYDASDKFCVHVCKMCGMIASYNEEHIHNCKTCSNRIDFAYVEIPYACKLLFQELITMNAVPRLIVE